jgi:hypothetical protein
MLAHCLALRPLQLGAELAAPLLERCRTLLLGSSRRLQGFAMAFLAAALNSAPLAPCSAGLLLESLALMLQCSPAAPPSAPVGDQQQHQQQVEQQQELEWWWQQLQTLLSVLLDRATACRAAAGLLLPRINGLAVIAAAATGSLSDSLQLQFCQLCRGALLAQPPLLEGSTQLLQLFSPASPACRQVLLQCLALYLRHQRQQCGSETVSTAVVAALSGAGIAPEVRGR